MSGPKVLSTATAVLITMALLLSSPALTSVEDPQLLPTPPMGFNNWNRFECGLNESLFTTTADAMVSKGFLAAGYDRLNLDDCWLQTSRATNGSLLWNTTLFPHGLIWLGEYLRERGFFFGIYEDSGNETCGGYPGSLGHEKQDAETFESWGIDYLKLDGCHVFPTTEARYESLYKLWHNTLINLTHPLIFSQSAPAYFSREIGDTTNNTNWYKTMDYIPYTGELARHSTDILIYNSTFTGEEYWASILDNYGYEVLLARYQQRPGYYNDPDFLTPDSPGLTIDEKKSHFALWASFSAPLIISAYIPDLSDEEVTYLTNQDIIAVDQDPLTLQATLVSQDGTFDVLTKSLANGDRLLTVLNRANKTESTTVSLERVGLTPASSSTNSNGPNHPPISLPIPLTAVAHDLWTNTSTTVASSIPVTLSAHATAIYRLSNISMPITPTGMIFNTKTLSCLTAFALAADSGTSPTPDGPNANANNNNSPMIKTQSVTLINCTGSDSQVWRVTPSSSSSSSSSSPSGNSSPTLQISPLANPSLCLTSSSSSSSSSSSENQQLSLQPCLSSSSPSSPSSSSSSASAKFPHHHQQQQQQQEQQQQQQQQQLWTYAITGLLQSLSTSQCLTQSGGNEGSGSQVLMQDCAASRERDSQVFGIPGGVGLVDYGGEGIRNWEALMGVGGLEKVGSEMSEEREIL